MMTRETIGQRLAALERDRQALMGQVHAHDGAIADCQHWLKELDKAEAAKGGEKKKEPAPGKGGEKKKEPAA